MSGPDRRLLLVREDRAARSLEGLVPAGAYLDTTPMTVAAPGAPIHGTPEASTERVDQLLFGEGFEVLETLDGWAFGRGVRDGYVGWTPAGALRPGAPDPTHRVRAIRTFAMERPELRAASFGPLSLNALVRVEAVEGRWARAANAGWVPSEHLAPIGDYEADAAAVAVRFVGAPYLWGGRDGVGIDCSGLVQQALFACGRACPRDSDQQASLGRALETGEALARNDLVFWPGHVGLMLDEARVIHANSWHMRVEIEPLAETAGRMGPPTAFRRPLA